jgi:hypothetical protein
MDTVRAYTVQDLPRGEVADSKTSHYDFLGEDRLHFLVHATKEDIMTFLKWVLDVYSRVRKRSILDEYWRVWCMSTESPWGRVYILKSWRRSPT